LNIDLAKVEAVRRRLASMFSGTYVDVVDADGSAVEFRLRPIGLGPRRVRISRELFHDQGSGDEILPYAARELLKRGSLLITAEGIEFEGELR